MLEIWINGKFHDESEQSCPSMVPIEGRRQYNWMDLRILGSWKLE